MAINFKIHFTVISRYDPGTGPQYVTLPPVMATCIAEAIQLAKEQAVAYFRTTPGLNEAMLNETRIRPAKTNLGPRAQHQERSQTVLRIQSDDHFSNLCTC